jgi:PAS domain S-box-containing protein
VGLLSAILTHVTQGAVSENEGHRGKRLQPAFDGADSWQGELVRWVLLALLGAAASYLSVNIPYTEVFIEGRWIFGYIGFALLSRWWSALLLTCLLSLSGFHKLPLGTVFVGNMMYAFPILLVIRLLHMRVLNRVRRLVWYGAAWLLLILLCYQLFTTPVIWGFLAFLHGNPIWPGVLEGWREQPFLIESLLVGVISALAMMLIRSNAALRASRRELATTLYSIGDGVIATDAGGQVRRMNPVAENLTDWREAEAVGKPLEAVFCLLNEETRESVESPVVQVLEKGIIVGLANHALLVSRDGIERPIVDSAAPICDENDLISGVVLVFRDQTEERAARKALKESHDQLLLALRNARMGIWGWDVNTNRVDWYGEHWSLFGIPIEAFGGTIDDVQKYVHPDDREQSLGVFHRTVETGADFDNTYRVVWPDGSVHWMHSYGKLVYNDEGEPRRIVGTTQDITERVRAEEERERLIAQVREQARRMEQILVTVPAGVLLLDAEGWVLQANPVAEKDLAALAGARVGDILTCLGDRPLAELLTSPPTKGLWHEVRADKHTFEVIARPVEKEAESEYWVLVTNDVTQEREIQAQLQQQARLAAVGQLAAGIAHDFNNIMATIILYAQMAARSEALSERDREGMGVINQQARHATRLIEQILDFSRQAMLKRRPLDLLPLLKEQVRLLERTLPEHVGIELDYGRGEYTVDADPTRMQQMIINLAVNARDAMPGGGELRFELSRVEVKAGGGLPRGASMPPLSSPPLAGGIEGKDSLPQAGRAGPEAFPPAGRTEPETSPGGTEGGGMGPAEGVGQRDGHRARVATAHL